MRNRFALTLGLIVSMLWVNVTRHAFADTAPPAPHSCQYDNDINLQGPDNGEPVALYEAYQDPHAAHAWQYDKIIFCRRPGNAGAYVIVVDINKVANPPQEILETKLSPDGYWTHLFINMNRKGSSDFAKDRLELVIRKDQQFLWVFERNPNELDGIPLLQASLMQQWKK